MIQDKPEPFRPLPCFFDGCKSRKKKLAINVFPKSLLRSSLKFSEILQSSPKHTLHIITILGIGIQKSDRYLNKNQVSVAFSKHYSYQQAPASIIF